MSSAHLARGARRRRRSASPGRAPSRLSATWASRSSSSKWIESTLTTGTSSRTSGSAPVSAPSPRRVGAVLALGHRPLAVHVLGEAVLLGLLRGASGRCASRERASTVFESVSPSPPPHWPLCRPGELLRAPAARPDRRPGTPCPAPCPTWPTAWPGALADLRRRPARRPGRPGRRAWLGALADLADALAGALADVLHGALRALADVLDGLAGLAQHVCRAPPPTSSTALPDALQQLGVAVERGQHAREDRA